MATRLSGLAALFLYLETPTNPMHVGGVIVADPATAPRGRIHRDDVIEFLAQRLHLAPPLRRRLATVPLNLDHPLWVDADVDLDAHVHAATLGSPGGQEQLAALTARLMGRRLDRGRPLWDVQVVDGLAGGRVALITRMHHAAIDGVSGAEMAAAILSSGGAQTDASAGEGPDPATRPSCPDLPPGDGELLARAAVRMAARPLSVLRAAPGWARSVAGVVRGRGSGTDEDRLPGPFAGAPQPWNGSLGRRRNVAFARVPLADLTLVRRRLGSVAPTRSVTVNDVLLAAVTAALRRFLVDRGAPLARPVVAMVPLALAPQNEPDATPNRISATFVALPVGEADPAARLGLVAERMADAKGRHDAGGGRMTQHLAELVPGTAMPIAARIYGLLRLADHHRPVWNTVVSNVRGPSEPLAVAGATVEAIYPLGPVHEMNGLNITLFSYRNEVFVGVNADDRLLPDAGLIAESLPAAVAELVAAGRDSSLTSP